MNTKTIHVTICDITCFVTQTVNDTLAGCEIKVMKGTHVSVDFTAGHVSHCEAVSGIYDGLEFWVDNDQITPYYSV